MRIENNYLRRKKDTLKRVRDSQDSENECMWNFADVQNPVEFRSRREMFYQWTVFLFEEH